MRIHIATLQDPVHQNFAARRCGHAFLPAVSSHPFDFVRAGKMHSDHSADGQVKEAAHTLGQTGVGGRAARQRVERGRGDRGPHRGGFTEIRSVNHCILISLSYLRK